MGSIFVIIRKRIVRFVIIVFEETRWIWGFLPFDSELFGPPRKFVFSTKEWLESADSGGAIYKKFLGASITKRKLPKSFQPISKVFFSALTWANPESFIVKIKNGRVVTENGFIIAPKDTLILDLSCDLGPGGKKHFLLSKPIQPKLVLFHERVATIASTNDFNYFHWLFDTIPKFEMLKKSGLKYDKLFVNSKLSFQRESLDLLGVPFKKIINIQENKNIKADYLIVPSLPGGSGNPKKWVCSYLRKLFLPKKRNKLKSKLIYLTRTDASSRRILNENELMELLSKYGFEMVSISGLTIKTQAELFDSSKVVFSPHGAGLSNIVFCRKNTKIIEIFPKKHLNVCYWALSNLLYLDYYYMVSGDGLGDSLDMIVNLDSVEKILAFAGINKINLDK